jgi:polysaccharide biosynthesis/export protein
MGANENHNITLHRLEARKMLCVTGREPRAMEKHQRTLRSGFLIRKLLGLSLCVLCGVGCAAAPQGQVSLPETVATSPAVNEINNGLASAALQASATSADYRLGPEDVLQITLFNMPPAEASVTPRTTEVLVDQQGKITLPLLGEVVAGGLTTAALEQLLRQRYDQYLQNPLVGVQVKDYRSQQVSVMGSVGRPGVFQLTGPRTLADLLSMAGGINERAGGQVHIYRQGPEGRQTHMVDLLALANNPGLVNVPVQARDVINVPQAGMFFVDGAVRKPGSYTLSRPYRLTQALAMAGGVNDALAKYSDVSILRRQNGMEADRISVDLEEIQAARAPDPWIEAEDVIVVPTSTGKWFLERFIGRFGIGGLPTIGAY